MIGALPVSAGVSTTVGRCLKVMIALESVTFSVAALDAETEGAREHTKFLMWFAEICKSSMFLSAASERGSGYILEEERSEEFRLTSENL